MSYQDVRHWYEDPPTEEEIERAERRKAFETHRLCDCGLESCYPCRSELSFCTICKGGEGTLPYTCPGQKNLGRMAGSHEEK